MKPLSPRKLEVIRRFAAEIATYPLEQVEEVIREDMRRQMEEMRRKYPELFDEN